MTLGVKFLIGGVSLATTSCGGYMVYKKISTPDAEKTQEKVVEPGGEEAKLKSPSNSVQEDTSDDAQVNQETSSDTENK